MSETTKQVLARLEAHARKVITQTKNEIVRWDIIFKVGQTLIIVTAIALMW